MHRSGFAVPQTSFVQTERRAKREQGMRIGEEGSIVVPSLEFSSVWCSSQCGLSPRLLNAAHPAPMPRAQKRRGAGKLRAAASIRIACPRSPLHRPLGVVRSLCAAPRLGPVTAVRGHSVSPPTATRGGDERTPRLEEPKGQRESAGTRGERRTGGGGRAAAFQRMRSLIFRRYPSVAHGNVSTDQHGFELQNATITLCALW